MRANAIVLVIEDDEVIQAMLECMLGMEGYRVLGAVDGLSGLFEAGRLQPDLIILDMGLPMMDGEAFLLAYHQTPPPHAPVIGISAYLIETQTISGLAAFMKKPFDFDQLRSTLNSVLRDYARI